MVAGRKSHGVTFAALAGFPARTSQRAKPRLSASLYIIGAIQKAIEGYNGNFYFGFYGSFFKLLKALADFRSVFFTVSLCCLLSPSKVNMEG
jgi:hypothetical protein